ncbi:MAG TPA: hypothetical protein VMG74_00395 [Gaiellaceae bacterium]|nr:hypothetical protein [Gaiellaceae bacterium]
MTDVEQLIISELERMSPLPDATRANWADVLQRAGVARRQVRLSRRPILAFAGALVVCLAIAVPAFGLSQDVVSWFSAPAAPGPAQEGFHSLDVGAPAGMAPGVSGTARSVMDTAVAGKDVHLWVAPTKSGGFCLYLETYGGGCDRDRSLTVSPGLAAHTMSGPWVVFGDVLPAKADHLQVTFANGESVSVPLTFVSDPINAGFFVYQVPSSDLAASDWPATFAAVGSDGTTLATATLSGLASVPAPLADSK